MTKQAIKKGAGIRPKISDIKGKLGLNKINEKDLSKSSADKPISFIPMGDAFCNALKISGIAEGYCTVATGWSNTGKSTMKNMLIASCMKLGILPVIYETEQNFDFKYAIACGMKATPIYGDVEIEKIDTDTGEIYYETENRIVDYEGDFIYFDNSILAEKYGYNDYSTGKPTKQKRKIAVIEDIACSIKEILDMQDNGEIQQPICFIWDSVGSLPSFKSYNSKVGNPMFDAAALSASFNTILNNRIPASRRVDAPYTNTFFCVNKIWNDSMNSMNGVPSIELKGGKSIFYSARLIIHCGGLAKSSVKKLTATAKGQTYQYGIITKLRSTKCQLPEPYNVVYEGEVACVHNGMIRPDDVENYKKLYIKDILKRIEEMGAENVKEDDITFGEEESMEE